MYKKVETSNELNLFNHIFKNSFKEKKYETEEFDGQSFKYLVKNNENNYAGTVELIPYNPNSGKTTIEDMFKFEDIIKSRNITFENVIEIDKLSVLKSERKSGTLDNLIGSMLQISKKEGYEYAIALVNPVLFRALKVTYGIPVEKAGKLIKTKEYSVQPAMINLKEMFEDTSWDKNGYMNIWFEKELVK